MINKLKQWAKIIKKDVLTLWFCQKHPKMPTSAKILAIFVVAYALSPIDLIPDFIPVIGYLDDLIIVPIGVFLTLKLVPNEVIEDSRKKASEWIENKNKKPVNWYVGVLIVLLWLFLAYETYKYLIK